MSDAAADERILVALHRAEGAFVPSSRLATDLGCSRAAVAKQVSLLRGRGFDIEAAPRRGYALRGLPDSLAAPVLRLRLATAWLGRELHHFEVCGSTSDVAAELAREGAPHGTCVLAEAQARGRGRLGRSWYSPRGDNLYLSLLLRPSLPPQAAPPLTLVAAVATARALRGLGVEVRLKWPNDVLASGRKLAGILAEMSCELDRVLHVVIGVGVNLNSLQFSEELTASATSVRLLLGRPVDRALFACRLLQQLEQGYDEFIAEGPSPALAAWKEIGILGCRVRASTPQGERVGIASDLDESGALLLSTPEGILRVLSGEILELGP